MLNEQELRTKLRKIEALFAGAGTLGERGAAEAAMQRIQGKLLEAAKKEAQEEDNKPVDYQFSMTNQWSRQLFMALCRKYNLDPFRRYRQRYTTVMVLVSKNFVDTILWPEYLALNGVLKEYISAVAEKIIQEEVHKDTTEAKEIDDVLALMG